ncbi:DUF2237 family protein [Robertkochia aurantiaca]|uniref:DUF2237 family protein n=1 Tax=Robertkochia aurantiaca TaxID=2873700 RepID=UPI001CCC9E02|nr:DUF2237 domain-containing protein [Robertkochia sp. 3YJGBD-33]
METITKTKEKNVLGTELKPCGFDPVAGYMRDGYCRLVYGDSGTHLLCAVMSEEFLEFSRLRGNDLVTPIPQWRFPGLKPGDHWCLCVSRWIQAERKGVAPKVVLESTHQDTLKYIDFELLLDYKY